MECRYAVGSWIDVVSKEEGSTWVYMSICRNSGLKVVRFTVKERGTPVGPCQVTQGDVWTSQDGQIKGVSGMSSRTMASRAMVL